MKTVYHDEYIQILDDESETWKTYTVRAGIDGYKSKISWSVTTGEFVFIANKQAVFTTNEMASITRFMQENLTPVIAITDEILKEQGMLSAYIYLSINVYTYNHPDIDGRYRYLILDNDMKKIGCIGYNVDMGWTFWPDIFTVGREHILADIVLLLRHLTDLEKMKQ